MWGTVRAYPHTDHGSGWGTVRADSHAGHAWGGTVKVDPQTGHGIVGGSRETGGPF